MSSTTSIPAETTARCDYSKVKVGSVYSRHSFGKVVQKTHDQVLIENSNGDRWTIGASIIALEFTFADQFDDEEQVSRTAMIELMLDHPRTAMTINFNKKVKPNDNADQILELINQAIKDGKAPTKTAVRKLAAEQQVGEERVMVGYHNRSFDEHGRLRFQESDKGQRLVDPRTLNSVVLNRTKYTIKK